ncbi:MAG: NYN domain-containing protein [Solirubrobacterales bacterium]
MKTNVYIDGFNLYYGCLKDRPYRWLDLSALCRNVLPKDQIHRIRYFTALVDARPDDPRQPVRQQTYLRALRTIPSLSIHLGIFRTRRTRLPLVKPRLVGDRYAEVWKTEEKGSDVNLATYLMLDVFKRDCDVAVVISNDADLKAPIEIARNELGIAVGVLNPHPPARRSRDLNPTFFKQIRKGALARSQLPPSLRDPQGEIRKPPGW